MIADIIPSYPYPPRPRPEPPKPPVMDVFVVVLLLAACVALVYAWYLRRQKTKVA